MSLASLWLPILLSAVLVFVVSSVIHMATPLHKADYRKLPNEEAVLDALRPFDLPAGDYVFPCVTDHKEMKDPAFLAKWKTGPAGMVTVMEKGVPTLGKSLALWFVYCVVVSVIAAYVTSRAVGPGAPARAVFRFAGVTTYVGYSLALWQNSIWFKKDWRTVLRSNVDGLAFALVTAGTFGWLWPR